jgi:hypothetical protein
LGYPPHRIDVLTSLSGVEFAAAWPRRVDVTVDGLPVSFVGRDDLIVNKAAAGRPKDLADLDVLTRLPKPEPPAN